MTCLYLETDAYVVGWRLIADYYVIRLRVS